MSLPATRAHKVRGALLVITVVLATAGMTGLTIVKPVPSAASVFRRAQDFVESHHSGRFNGTFSSTYSDKEQQGTETSNARMSGVFDDRVGSRTVASSADEGVEETIVVGKTSYWRSAEDAASLDTMKFAKETLDDEAAALAGAMSLGFSGPQAGSEGLKDVFGYGLNPRVVSRDGDVTVIKVDLDAERLFGLMGKKLKASMTLTLTVAGSGELRQFRTQATMLGSSADSTMTFADWGKPVEIKAPDKSMIDATPDVYEEAVQAFTAAPLYMPSVIPQGWTLDYADVIAAEDADDHCDQVELDFDPPGGADDEDAPYAYMYELATSCAEKLDSDMRPFSAGAYVGGISTDEDGYSWVQIRVDDKTTIQVESDLAPADIATMLSNLRRLSFPATFGSFNAGPTTTS